MNQCPHIFLFLWALIRSCVHLLVMGVSIIIYGTVLLIVALFVRGEIIYRIGVAWLNVCVGSAKWILGVRYRVFGIENLPLYEKGQGVVILAKHQSTYDTFVMPLVLRHVALSYVFKKELLTIPFFGWGLGRMDMIFIDRQRQTSAFRKVIEQGRKFIAMGNWIIMFPEGTRVARGQVGQYRKSGVRLAQETQSLVVPVAITSARCWGPKAIVKYPGVIDISICKPIQTDRCDLETLISQVQNEIEMEMQRLDPLAYPHSDS